MTDPIARLNTALEGRYRVERQLGEVGDSRSPTAPPATPPPNQIIPTTIRTVRVSDAPGPRRGPRAGRPWLRQIAVSWALLVAVPPVAAAQNPQDRTEAEEEQQNVPAAAGAAVGVTTEDYVHELAPRAQAVDAAGSTIAVDGSLDEAVWGEAPPITEFVQIVPLEGRPGSERTEVRIVYDEEAVYVGAVLHDSRPVTTQLARRDAMLSASDAFEILFDSYHEHETAYQFATNPSAVRRDAIVSGGGTGGGTDFSWDPVWDVATQVTSTGWSLEMRIPFSQLRFRPTEEHVWGIQIERTIQRNQEMVTFPFTPTLERGGISRYGHLDGLVDLEAGKRLELLPYVAARGEYLQLSDPAGVSFDNPFRSGSDHFGHLGVDIKYRLGSNLTLDATVNPDFGQVELDPSVINLTAFETRYEERRPFFVEGADIFQFGEGGPGGSGGQGAQLLYSRRIGRAPQGSSPSGAVFEDAPATTTIYQAGKITGRVGDGWSFGILEAVTAEETASYIEADRSTGETVVEPASTYVVGRLRRLIGEGDTRFGVIASATNRRLSGTPLQDRLHSAAYTGGLDFAHEWGNREWRLSGIFTGSLVRGSAEAIELSQLSSTRYYQRPDADHLEPDPERTSLAGYYGFVELLRQAGTFAPRVVLGAVSPGYEVNDLGFQPAADRLILDTNFTYQQPVPGDILRSWRVNGGPDARWNYDGRRVFTNLNLTLRSQFLNYWRTSFRFEHIPRYDDDRLTRGGPMADGPRGSLGRISVDSDSRRSTTAGASAQWQADRGGSWSRRFGLNLNMQPRESLEIRFGPNLSQSYSEAQYVTSVADPLADRTYGRRYVFAGLDRTTLSFDTRVNVTFSPDLSLQLYVEPFISIGDYGQLREFRAPDTFDFLDYGREVGTVERMDGRTFSVDPDGSGAAEAFTVSDRDFNYRSLIGNAVLRWEWRPGSTIYLVWQQRRINSVTGSDAYGDHEWVGRFDLSRDGSDMFGIAPDNIFVVKVNYWLNP